MILKAKGLVYLLIPSILILLGAFFIYSYSGTDVSISEEISADTAIERTATVCRYIDRHQPDGSYFRESTECNHNLFYNSGANATRDLLGNGGNFFRNITPCNATAGCADPVAAASEDFNALTGCGFDSTQGTYSLIGQKGNWSIFTTFTSTCDGIETNATRLTNDTGTNLGGATFTLATLQTDDKLTLNWTNQVQ